MASKIKGLTIELNGDTTGFKAALDIADKSLRATQGELKALKEGLKLEWDSAKFSKAQDLAKKAVGETNQKVEILRKGLAELEKQGLDNTNDDFRKLTKEINYTENAAKRAADQLGEISRLRLDKIAKDIDSVGATLENAGKKALALTVALGAGFVASGKAAIDYESAFAGVRKTVTATESELQAINAGIREMTKEIPQAATEIAAVAEAAGQLGIKKQAILDFTGVMINLGVATNLSSTDAASSLAKFANITQMAEENYSRLGSVIVALGNSSATTESDIVSMATRLASSGALIGLTEAQIMAVATALSSVGIEAEAGGTAFGKVFKEIETLVATNSDKIQKYAEVAGMSAKEFTDAWGNDPIIALSAFINGLGSLESQGGNAIVTLEEMGLTEVRLSNAILALSGSGDLLTRSVETANKAWNENTALQIEAEQRYKTTESQLQLLKNTLTDTAITIGNDLLPMINNGALPPAFSGSSALAGYDAVNGPTETCIKHYWDVNIQSAVQLSRRVTGFVIAPDLGRGLPDDKYKARHEPLSDITAELAEGSKLIIKATADITAGTFVFDVVEPADRTAGQAVLPPVVFSLERQNVLNMGYQDITSSGSNLFYATRSGDQYADEALTLMYFREDEDEPEGIYRHEKHLNVRSDTPTAGQEYEEMRRQALHEMESYIYNQSFSTVVNHARMRYRVDYDLSDIVTVYNRQWGVTLDTQITGVTTTATENGTVYSVTFGESKPNFIQRLSRDINNR